jgi:hypothetical protein
MGWGGGTYVMGCIMRAVDTALNLTQTEKVDFYAEVIEELQSEGWDCCDDLAGTDEAYDLALEVVRRRWCDKNGEDYNEYFGYEDEDYPTRKATEMTQEERERIRELKRRALTHPPEARQQAIDAMTSYVHPDHQPTDFFDGEPICSF